MDIHIHSGDHLYHYIVEVSVGLTHFYSPQETYFRYALFTTLLDLGRFRAWLFINKRYTVSDVILK